MSELIQDKPPGMGAGFTPLGDIPKPKSAVVGWEPLPMPAQQTNLENKQSRPAIPRSPNNYIAYTSDRPEIQGSTITLGRVDVVHLGQTTAYCCPSQETIDSYQGNLSHGQDATSISVIGDRFILTESDGVGSAYLSHIAAQEATSSIAADPSLSLQKNLQTATDALRQVELPESNSGNSLTDTAWRELREKEGSETMLNQLIVNSKTGEVEDGLFLGDGGLTVLRTDGSREHYPPPEALESENVKNRTSSRLSTKRGVRGQTRSLEEVVGKKIVLSSGDSILLYSDSMQHVVKGKLLIDQVCDVIVSEGDDKDAKLATLFEEAAKIDINDDDKTLIRYVQL